MKHPADHSGPPFGEARDDQRVSRPLPVYRVVLANNATLALMFVIQAVMELTRFCREEATQKMWEAHHCGRALLLVTHLERAELYVEQFAERGLLVTIEPN